MRKRKKAEDQLAPWIISYGDMVTLLLTFFVLLYSFSLVDLRKFRAMSSSMQQAFGNGGPGGGGVFRAGGDRVVQLGTGSSSAAAKLSPEVVQLAERARKYLDQEKIGGVANVISQERGVVIRFEDSVFFDSGQADLKPEAEATARKLAGFLRTTGNHIRIEGHADDRPIHTARYASNWELSVARATRFLTYLEQVGHLNPEQLSAAGYGEYRPVASNDSEEGRRKNRRVDVVILRTGLSEAEPRPAQDQGGQRAR
ncbi:MAG: flagellar motor protein MotB [Chitinophagales bacterium]